MSGVTADEQISQSDITSLSLAHLRPGDDDPDEADIVGAHAVQALVDALREELAAVVARLDEGVVGDGVLGAYQRHHHLRQLHVPDLPRRLGDLSHLLKWFIFNP